MRRFDALLFSTCVFAPSFALGQVNTEKLRSWDRPGISGHAEFQLDVVTGNVDLVQVGAGVRVQYAVLEQQTTTGTAAKARQRPRHLIYAIGNTAYAVKREDRFVNNGFVHARWTAMWKPRFGTELFSQLQYNELSRLSRRVLFGAGARAAVVDEEALEVHLGAAYMLELEALDVPLVGLDAQSERTSRLTSYISIKGYLDDPRVQLVNTVYVQPRLSDFADYRVLDESELQIVVVGQLRFVLAMSLRYDSRPPTDVEKLDVAIQNKLRVDF